MNLLRRLLAWIGQLLAPRAEIGRPRRWDPHTNPVDIQQIARELRLRDEGRRLGAAGVPLDTDTELCGTEHQSLVAIEQARSDYLEWGQLRLKSLQAELHRLDVRPTLKAAEDGAGEFERRAEADITANASEIRQLADTARSRQQEFDRFRERHARADLPHYPQGTKKAFAWVFAISLITVEALLNTNFFAKGLSGGLIDGFTEALIASMLNVMVSLALGALVIRFVNHTSTGGKLLGVAGVLAAACFIVLLALLVSHYREALVLRLPDPQTAAVSNLQAKGFHLEQVASWYLFFVSIVFGVLAIADGYKLDDRYPGYGKLHRQLVVAMDDYTAAINQLQEHLEQLKSEALDKLDHALAHSGAAIASYKGVISDKKRCRADLNNLIFDAQPMLKALLAEFRQENTLARRERGYGVPPSFASLPSLEDRAKDMPNFDTAEDEKNLHDQEKALHDFVQLEPEIRRKIQAAYNARFSSVNTLVGHFDGVDLSSRLNENEATSQPPASKMALGRG